MVRLSCAALVGAIALASGVDAASAGDTIRVRRAEIVDANGFERPLVAATVFVPADWQVEGGVFWSTQADPCGGGGYNFDWRAISPDGWSAIQIFPMERWQWNSWGAPDPAGCPSARITSARHYLEEVVRRFRPGARLLDFRRRPDIEQELAQFNQTTPMPMGELRSWAEVGEALIGYQQNGVEMRETLTSAVVLSVTTTLPMAGMPAAEFLQGSTLPGLAVRAPNGELDFQMVELIRKSIQPGPEWSDRIARHEARIAGIQIQGARDRSRITAETGEAIRQMQADSWRRYSESSDRLARERSEAIRGVETYDDPYIGGTVQLDNSYDQAWRLNDGTYVLSNDPSFDPYRVFGIEGRRLEVTR